MRFFYPDSRKKITVETGSLDIGVATLDGAGQENKVGGEHLALLNHHNVSHNYLAPGHCLEFIIPADFCAGLEVELLVRLVSLVVLIA